MTFEDDAPTNPDGTNLPVDDSLEVEIDVDFSDKTPGAKLAQEHRCPECETGVCGRGLVRLADFVPPPQSREQAQAYEDCVATQSLSWRFCKVTGFFQGIARIYWGIERRVARLPPPSGIDRRAVPSPTAGADR